MSLRVERKKWGGREVVRLSFDPVDCRDDLFPKARTPSLTLRPAGSGSRAFDKIPMLQIKNGGFIAFPELVRAYAALLMGAADFLEGNEPIDFQI